MEVAARRLVLKVGTSTLTAGAYALSADRLDGLASAIARCKRDGRDVVLVTSGAIVTGASRLGLKAPPRAMPDRQALAAVGQAILMHEYDRRFAGHGILVGQVLLTAGDFDHRRRYLNARNTLEALLRRGAVPIVNENDTVATEEIRIGDNDTLSARVAALIDADLLCILSDVDGLYTGDPRKDPNATRIAVVDRITRKLETFAAETGSLTGVGGMATKVRAARMATAAGVEVVITHGGDPDAVARVLAGEDVGTRFRAQAAPLRGRRRCPRSRQESAALRHHRRRRRLRSRRRRVDPRAGWRRDRTRRLDVQSRGPRPDQGAAQPRGGGDPRRARDRSRAPRQHGGGTVSTTMNESARIVAQARRAADALRVLSTDAKNAALLRLAELLESSWPSVAAANERDVTDAASQGRAGALLDRLRLTPQRLAAVAAGVRDVARLADPVGTMTAMTRRPNGMRVGRVRAPIGVILMIYEARPNVTIDAAVLCLKAGNAIILRGGREARHTNLALGSLFPQAGFPDGAAQVVADPDRALVQQLLRDEGIDVVIPRGNEGLIRTVVENARMPVLKHYKGVTHLFVDRAADLDAARAIAVNAKTSRPSTCNALETLLVDAPIADAFLPEAARALRAAGVEVRGCARTAAIVPDVVPATDEDWATEYLDLILSVRVVDGFDDAVAHIRRYSTGLAESIVTNDHRRAMRFVDEIDSAAVLVNASTRLVDGAEFGLGAEIGISTNRIGPRGPMGLEELTTEKWVVLGDGHVRP